MVENLKSHFDAQASENQTNLNSVMSKLDQIKSLLKEKVKAQKSELAEKTGKTEKSGKGLKGLKSGKERDGEGLDVTDDMLNMFVRLEVQRRYFNIVAIEMLCKQFGMKETSSINAVMKRQTKIDLSNLVAIGRNLTLEQYFEIKEEFESNPKAKAQMIKDRQTYIIYKDQDDDRLNESEISSESEQKDDEEPSE